MNSLAKKITLLLFLTSIICVHAQQISGTWKGELNVGAISLRLVFHIQQTADGYSATMDSPDQVVKDIPVASTTFENNILKLSIAVIGADYEGMFSADTFKGTFTQRGQSFPLDLVRGSGEINRPQEPKKPYPYYEEEVRFVNEEDGVTLAGTLTLPKKDGVFPAVILISGSGAQNRDSEFLGHKPFLVLADFLTRNGIAVLRHDDRGTAESTGDFSSATTFDFSKDTEAGVKYLLTRKEIDGKKIGLIGESEGGVIAPMVAARSKDVAFIVMMAGIGIQGDKLMLLQKELIERALGVDEQILKNGQDNSRKVYDLIINSNNREQLKDDLMKFFPVNEIDKLLLPWMQYFLKYNPAKALEKVKCSVLAINGSKDLQVPPSENLPAIKKALMDGGNNKFVIIELEGLNHLFQECETGLPSEYPKIEQTISPTALNTILAFIQSLQ